MPKLQSSQIGDGPNKWVYTSADAKATVVAAAAGLFLSSSTAQAAAPKNSMTPAFTSVTCKIALAILLAVGPVFVVLALFKGTRGLFAGWLKALVMLALTPLFAVLGGAIAFGTIHTDPRVGARWVGWFCLVFFGLCGMLAIRDPSRAAVRFALMASEGSQSVMGRPPAGRKDRERYARMTVTLFMRGLEIAPA